MGKFFDEIPDDLREWILDQKMFWVATAPLSGDGHVNTSPKGRPSFNLVGNNACWYTDMTGSGNETLSHLYEEGNGRITVMFVAFEGPARIVRFFGRGKVFERGTPEFRALLPDNDERILPGTRAIIWVDIHKVGTSCGFSVPFFDYTGERLTLDEYYQPKEDPSCAGDELSPELMKYWNMKNSFSIDHMPGLKFCTDPSQSLETPFNIQKSSSSTTSANSDVTHITLSKITLAKFILAAWGIGAFAGLVFAHATSLFGSQSGLRIP